MIHPVDAGRPRVEAVVFDLGGVLLDWNPRHLYRQVFVGDDRAMEEFLATICTLEWHHQHDLGRPMTDSCSELADLHPDQAALIWAWRDRADEMVAGPIQETVDLLLELHRRDVACYALTNWPAETFERCRLRFDFLSCFRGIVVSGEEGIAKPDPEIFRRLLERHRLDPEATLFVDDHPGHVAAARSLGMHAVRFEGAESVRLRLGQFDVGPGPGQRAP